MPGTNLKSLSRHRAKQLFWKFMAQRTVPSAALKFRLGRRRKSSYPTLVYKAGVPVTNTPADGPDKAGQICIDITNKDVYYCTDRTGSTTFIWIKISD